MKMILLLFGAFILQEPIVATSAIILAKQNHVPMYAMHLTFLLATIIDIIVGYYLGKYLSKRIYNSRIKNKIDYFVNKLKSYQSSSDKIAGFFLAIAIFPVSAICMPMLNISFWKSFWILLIGEIIFWYGVIILIIDNVYKININPVYVFTIIFLLIFVFKIIIRKLKNLK